MIQGLEGSEVCDYVSSHSGICVLEHDGFGDCVEVWLLVVN